MKYQIYKFDFLTSVHFGEGGLTKGTNILHADTIFSALCIEAVKRGSKILQRLIVAAENDRLRISDGLPYIDDTYYIPKPLVELKIEKEGDSILKKALKKLSYVPIDQLEKYLTGKMDIVTESDKFHDRFGGSMLVEKAAVHGQKETMPYAVDTYRYGKNTGLYICVACEQNEDLKLVEELLESLAITGIGGKISSGYGKFELRHEKMIPELEKRLVDSYNVYTIISVALPKEDELEPVLEGSGYRLLKRGGFISSVNYSDSFRKKKEVYLFQAGSSFKKKFEGSVLDVSIHGMHPVYRYAKPMFLGVM